MALIIGDLKSYVEQALFTFNTEYATKQRLYKLLWLPHWLLDYYWLSIIIVLFSIRSHWKECSSLITLYLGLYLINLFSICTGSMKMSANIPLMGIHMAISFILLYQARQHDHSTKTTGKRIPFWIIVCMTLWLINISAKRGLALDAWTYGGLNPFGDYAMKTEQIKGWMAPKEIGEAVDQASSWINQFVGKDESLLILTDLQILYPLTKRDSYRGIPFNFAVNEIPKPGKQREKVRDHIISNPPDWIVTHRSPSVISFVAQLLPYLELIDLIKESYFPVQTWNNYVILRRR